MPHLKSFAETQKGAFSKLTPEQKARIESRLSSSEEVMALHKRSQDRYDERNRIDKNSQTEFESFPSKKPL
ncbi:hypothetical protein LJR030_003623 [Rhizobium sp. LjRoot30]|uniref:hypothetical protein n=1 Tax=Rhizobium sp. LjRoot30 TaxID=3342320 RepID=UPI003ECDFFA2